MTFYICSEWGACPNGDCKHMHRHEFDNICKDRCEKIISMHRDLRPYCKPSIHQTPLTEKEKTND